YYAPVLHFLLLSLHDALPIFPPCRVGRIGNGKTRSWRGPKTRETFFVWQVCQYRSVRISRQSCFHPGLLSQLFQALAKKSSRFIQPWPYSRVGSRCPI